MRRMLVHISRFLVLCQVDDGFMDVGLLAHVSRTRVVSLFDQVKKSYVAPRTGPRCVDAVASVCVRVRVCVCACVRACVRDMVVIYLQLSSASHVHISCVSCVYACAFMCVPVCMHVRICVYHVYMCACVFMCVTPSRGALLDTSHLTLLTSHFSLLTPHFSHFSPPPPLPSPDLTPEIGVWHSLNGCKCGGSRCS